MRKTGYIDGIQVKNIDDIKSSDNMAGIVFMNIGIDINEWINCINAVFYKEKVIQSSSWAKKTYLLNNVNGQFDLVFEFNRKCKIDTARLNTIGELFNTACWLQSYIDNYKRQQVTV